MSLESGEYYITSADGGFPIGRRFAEDKSSKPKGIFKLPPGTKSVVSTAPRMTRPSPKLLVLVY